MANNYVTATVFPTDIPSNALTDEEKGVLEYSGFTLHDDHTNIYMVVEESLILDESPDFIEDETKEITGEDVLFRILGRVPEIKEIVIEGAFTCSKMRAGEFGGFVYRFSKEKLVVDGIETIQDKVQFADTSTITEMMRKGII